MGWAMAALDALSFSFFGWGRAVGETPTEKGKTQMAFDALEVALQINQLVAPLAQVIRQHDPDIDPGVNPGSLSR